MNKKIKIIELANNIANEKWDKVPKRIGYMGKTYKFDRLTTKYFVNEDFEFLVFKTDTLNNSVEILEDNTEEIEELPINDEDEKLYSPVILDNRIKINELVRAYNKSRKEKTND